MEGLSIRQKFLIRMLLESNEHKIEISLLAHQMEISERTVFREISSINGILEKSGIRLSVKNSAVTIEGAENAYADLISAVGNIPKRLLLTPKQRVIFIGAQLLLADEPYKSAYFSCQLHITEGTVSIYMNSIEEWLADKSLTLSRGRRSGICINGSEWNKRNVFVSLIYDYKPVEELLTYLYGTRKDPVLDFFFQFLFGSRAISISKGVVNLLPDKKIDDIPYMIMLFYTLISVKKSMAGHPMSLPEKFTEKAVSSCSPVFIEKLKQFFGGCGVPVIKSEIAYIIIHLPSKYIFVNGEGQSDIDAMASGLAKEVLRSVKRSLGMDMSENRCLASGIAHYFSLAIYRMKMGIQVKNPVLQQIKAHYSQLFPAVEKACRLVFSNYNLWLSEDEIGFVTMEIGAGFEEKAGSISILIICPNGLFASQILFSKVRSILQENDEVSIASLRDWYASKKEYDLVLSTVNIEPGAGKEQQNVMVVPPFLSEDNMIKIRSCINKIKKQNSSKTLRAQAKENESVHGSKLISDMLEILSVRTIPEEPFEDIVDRIARSLGRRQIVSDWQEVSRLLIKREKIGSVVVPNSRVALLHVRSDLIDRPFVGIYRLNGKIMMESAGFAEEPVDTFLVMLARRTEDSEVIEKMGCISAALIEKEGFASALRTENASRIRKRFAEILY